MRPAVRDRGLAAPLAALAAVDPDVARALATCGLPPVRRQERGFAGLLRIVLAQQVSAQAARAIRARLDAAASQLTAESFLALGDARLREVGLSRQKVRYGTALAEAVASGALDLRRIHRMADPAAVEALSALPGIGRWTAEVYLLFALQRSDVWPAGDLALQAAAQRLKGLAERPGVRAMDALAEAWRPHRSAAARFLWHYYSHPGV